MRLSCARIQKFLHEWLGLSLSTRRGSLPLRSTQTERLGGTTGDLVWTSACDSHAGMVRKVNEDACLEWPERGLWAVADGMGGHQAGDVASQMIIDALRQVPPPSGLEDFITQVKEHLQKAHQQLQEESARRYQHRVIGSTIVVLLTYEDQGACLWVGDSRIYRLQDGQLKQLTRDHSYVQDLIDKGLLKVEQAVSHPMANVITRAVGSVERLDIDLLTFPLQAQDAFLLCSDGLNKTITDHEIAGLLARDNSQEAAQGLIHLALARGANDNITVMVVKIEAGEFRARGRGARFEQ